MNSTEKIRLAKKISAIKNPVTFDVTGFLYTLIFTLSNKAQSVITHMHQHRVT